MYDQNAVKDVIKLSLKYLYMVDSDFCITYLKNTVLTSPYLSNDL